MQVALHKPVMLHEVKEMLRLKDEGTYLDCTFGFGGYSRMIMEATNSYLVAIDRDPHVRIYAQQLINDYPSRVNFIHTSFAESFAKLRDMQFDGIVMDLGVSSMQLDSGERGFSFIHDGPLDMRMSDIGYSAADFINEADEEKIADVIYQYGDESYSRRIAKSIVKHRKLEPIVNTESLANIVRSSIGFRKSKIDLATKTFQALRIYINDELGQLQRFLDNSKNILLPNARLVVVSFHSLEDRIVKNFFKTHSARHVAKSKYHPKIAQERLTEKISNNWLKILTKKPLCPSKEEIEENPRARSAKLRAAEKLERHDAS